ncbi:MAG: cupin domain-containing protein [Gemmatimonadaceae bacterium]
MKPSLIALTLLASAGLGGAIDAQTMGMASTADKPHAIIALPNAITWGPAPAILPSGAQAAVLEGDPSKPGPFTLRIVMPANYRIPPHYHPVTEHVTVLEGTFYVGMGETFDVTKAATLPAGTFAALEPQVRHFAFTKERTVIQLHGVGPWGLVYVNPADDPRNKASR